MRCCGPLRAILLSLPLVACGGGGGNGGSVIPPVSGACSTTAQKQWVLDTTRQWYLFPELLPAQVDIDAYATPQDLLDALTAQARTQGKDRFFSYLTTIDEDSAFFGEGQFVGFGFRLRIEFANHLFVFDVYEVSPAAEVGLQRGVEILAIDAGSGYRTIADWLSEDPTLGTALGPADEGVERGIRYSRNGTVTEVRLIKRIVTIDPIADADGVRVLPLAGTAGVGYVNLRTFISTADEQMRSAFDGFRSAGLDYFVVDLRYNGGGLVRTAELLGDLFGANRSPGDVFSRTEFNTQRSGANETRLFASPPVNQSVAPVRIAFITTGLTASASELVINSMQPWAEVAIVGANTYGKPVGQSAFDLSSCGVRLRLVTFRTVNALGDGDYFGGLASNLPFACEAEDPIAATPGDPAEISTAEALSWLESGQCSGVIGVAAAQSKPDLAAAARYPSPQHPDTTRAVLPGLF